MPTTARLLRGRSGWWWIGPGGIARLAAGHVSAGGELRDAAAGWLCDRGMARVEPIRAYSLTVLTTTACNAGCGYCFQNTGPGAAPHRPPRIANARLRPTALDELFAFVDRRMAAGGLDQLRLILFGGEPLLNRAACREMLRRASRYRMISAHMISNGTLLTTRVAADLAARGLTSMQITFDGDRADHDAVRTTRTGAPTFDLIVDNIARASRAVRLTWHLRVNVSRPSRDGIANMLDRLAEALDPPRFTISFAPVGDAGVGYSSAIRDANELAPFVAAWQRLAVDRGFRVPLPQAFRPCDTCGDPTGRYGAVVNADGTLASCWETAGRPEWTVGTVATGYLRPADLAKRWAVCRSADLYLADPARVRRYHDTVDVDLLDYLSLTGRL